MKYVMKIENTLFQLHIQVFVFTWLCLKMNIEKKKSTKCFVVSDIYYNHEYCKTKDFETFCASVIFR